MRTNLLFTYIEPVEQYEEFIGINEKHIKYKILI